MSGAVPHDELVRRVGELDWYHTMDLPGGLVTPGLFDHRRVVERYALPVDLAGRRCLDVGTFDGFFAFELERRGADAVVASELPDREALDWPVPLRRTDPDRFHPRRSGFDVAREALGSTVEHVAISVYDLTPERVGTFDFVFVGALLVHLRDPVGALMAVDRVCRGGVQVVEPTLPRWWPKASARFEALDGFFAWWKPSRAMLAMWLEAAGFVDVRTGPTFRVPFRARRGGLRHTSVTGRASGEP